jgi:hypothetical protein
MLASCSPKALAACLVASIGSGCSICPPPGGPTRRRQSGEPISRCSMRRGLPSVRALRTKPRSKRAGARLAFTYRKRSCTATRCGPPRRSTGRTTHAGAPAAPRCSARRPPRSARSWDSSESAYTSRNSSGPKWWRQVGQHGEHATAVRGGDSVRCLSSFTNEGFAVRQHSICRVGRTGSSAAPAAVTFSAISLRRRR